MTNLVQESVASRRLALISARIPDMIAARKEVHVKRRKDRKGGKAEKLISMRLVRLVLSCLV
jgi:hypothetical protein